MSTVDVDALPPLQSQILETLAARQRLGEPFWTFGTEPAVTRALRALQGLGLVEVWSGMVEKTQRAKLTEVGATAMFPPSSRYRSPLEREVERLTHQSADGMVADTRLAGIGIENGEVVIDTRPPHELVKPLAVALAQMLGDAPNYSETEMSMPNPKVALDVHAAGDVEWFTVTVQRRSGKTPHQLREEAEALAFREQRAADLAVELLRQIRPAIRRDPDEAERLARRGPEAVREIRGES